MSAELTDPDRDQEQPPQRPHRHVSPWWLVRDALLVLLTCAVVGALCGLLWELWWTPPTGLVLEHTWYPDDQGLKQLFAGSAQYVVVGLVGGLLTGAACAFLVDRVEVLTLATVAVGSVLAAWLMLQVGTALAPPDPATAAASAEDYTELPGTLEVAGDAPLASFPAGALTGLVAVFIGLTPTRTSRD